MKPELQRRVQRYGWDKAHADYEPYWGRQIEPALTALLEMAELQAGEDVLDIACGTGLITLPAANAVGPNGKVLGTDISDNMVQAAQAEALSRTIDNTEFRRMDAEDLQLPDGAFDVALCSLGLMYVPDPIKALGEMRRVLRQGGRAVAAVWGARANCGWAEIFPIVDSRVQSDVCPMFFQLGTQNALAFAFESAGFGDLTARRISTQLHYESTDDAIRAAFAGGPVALAYSRFDDVTRSEAHAEYRSSIEQYRDGNGYEIPGEFVVVSGRISNNEQ
jgi:ubiquinone/menaquinone biosynthesis C-methylase UbiE